MPTLNWTGESMRSGDLLYLSYANRADVIHYGQHVGEVLALWDGRYLPRIDGIRGEECSNPNDAAARVVELHEKFR